MSGALLDSKGIPLLNFTAWSGAAEALLVVFACGRLARPLWNRLVQTRDGARLDAVLLQGVAGLALAPAMILVFGQISGFPIWGRWPIHLLAVLGAALLVPLLIAPSIPTCCLSVRNRAPGTIRNTPSKLLETMSWFAVGATLFPLLCPALSPPINYDTLEYHIGVLPHYFESGRVTPIPHVFYSAQPLATEMIYFLGAILEGTPRGLSSGILNWMSLVMLVALLCVLLRRMRVPREIVPWSVLLLLAHPVIFKLELDRLSDLTGAVFLMAGLLALIRARRYFSSPVRTLAYVGLMAGGAISSKWTNAGTTAAILTCVGLSYVLRNSRSTRAAKSNSTFVLQFFGFTIGVAVPLIPWMIWLWIRAGNPFAPFAASIFPTESWSPEQLDFLLFTHAPLSLLSVDYFSSLLKRLGSFSLGPPIFALACGLALIHLRLQVTAAQQLAAPRAPRLHPIVIARLLPILAGAVIAFLFWGRLQQSADRFLAPVFAAGVVVFAAATIPIQRVLSRRRAVWLALLPVLMSLPYWIPQQTGLRGMPYADYATGRISTRGFLEVTLGSTVDMFEEANRLPETSRILAIGEARRYYFQRLITLASVFDNHPIRAFIEAAKSADDLRNKIREAGYTHLLVNEYELGRWLQFHPPRRLLDDFAFVAEQRAGPAGYVMTLARHPGEVEFGVTPLTPEKRSLYLEFLEKMRNRATFQQSGASLSPAMWIAPLDFK